MKWNIGGTENIYYEFFFRGDKLWIGSFSINKIRAHALNWIFKIEKLMQKKQ